MKKEECIKNIRKFVDMISCFDFPVHAFDSFSGNGIILRSAFGWQFTSGRDSFVPSDKFINESLYDNRLRICEWLGIKQADLLHGDFNKIYFSLVENHGENVTKDLFTKKSFAFLQKNYNI